MAMMNGSNSTYRNLSVNSTKRFDESRGFDSTFHPILVTIAILIVLANGVVLLIFRYGRLHRRRSNYILLSLTISDMVTGLVAIPLNIYCESTMSWKICLLSFEANRFISISTINHILLLTLEKYLSVMHPMMHRQLITKRNVTITVATIWFISLLVALIPLEWLLGLADVRNRFSPEQERKQTIHEIFVFAVFFVLPLTIMFVCYIRLVSAIVWHAFSAAGKRAKDATPRNISRYRRFKPMIMVLALLVNFILSWGWWFFGTIQRTNGDTIPAIPHTIRSILIIIRYCSSFLNPILYTLFRKDFKIFLKRVCIECCCPTVPTVSRMNIEVNCRGTRHRLPKIPKRNNQVLPMR